MHIYIYICISPLILPISLQVSPNRGPGSSTVQLQARLGISPGTASSMPLAMDEGDEMRGLSVSSFRSKAFLI